MAPGARVLDLTRVEILLIHTNAAPLFQRHGNTSRQLRDRLNQRSLPTETFFSQRIQWPFTSKVSQSIAIGLGGSVSLSAGRKATQSSHATNAGLSERQVKYGFQRLS